MQATRRRAGCTWLKASGSASTAPPQPPASRASSKSPQLEQPSGSVPTLSGVRRAAVIVALAVAGILVAAFLAACGSGEDEQVGLVTAGQVIGQFERDTGRPLQRAAEEDPAWDQLSYGLNPSPELLNKYGIFTVYVGKQGHAEALQSLLRDKATKKALERDAKGVYWELDSNSGTWVAYKRYSGNVVLVWFSGSKTQAVDDRFERLDRVLIDLPG
jgi:hypothetical protein